MESQRQSATRDLIRRYDVPGPRYTSYPTAVSFHAGFDEAAYRERLARADERAAEPLSLYAHLPFCEARCLYCGCNVVISPHREVAGPYLEHLLRELDLLAAALPHRRRLSQMQWGGGTPTYYGTADLTRLFTAVRERFTFTADAEIGIEVDPRVTSAEQIDALGRLGFNRISAGVQDFEPAVQQAIGRIQGFAETKALVDRARAAGFRSVNLDLIYGLPLQSLEGFGRTLERLLAIRPERVAVYSFAYVPWLKGHMRRIDAATLPGPGLKLELLALAYDAFTAAGYRAIGMDHFALPDDDMAKAADAGTLGRNFMGYTVQSAPDMVGIGISAIGDVGDAFVQNLKKLPAYYAALDAGRFPVERGFALDVDDRIRRFVIGEIMCNARLDFAAVEARFGGTFERDFAAELATLGAPGGPVTDGLLERTPGGLRVTERGRPFVRVVAMAFDRHLHEATAESAPFSAGQYEVPAMTPSVTKPARSRVAVVGGGICGLTLAHRLLDRADVVVFEAGAHAGGHATTVREDGFLVEAGPNGFLDRNAGARALATELGLGDALIEARPEARRRYVLRGGRLHRAPDSPPTLLSSGVLSPGGKLRLLLEPWARHGLEAQEETVHEFARRRIGAEAADALVDAAVAGISAGDSRTLSLTAAFPLMDEMEREHGSLIRAFVARQRAGVGAPHLLAFRGGMAQLVDALAARLGPRLRTQARVESVAPGAGGWLLTLADGATHEADRVVFTTPAHAAAGMLAGLDRGLGRTLEATPYSGVAVVALAYRKEQLRRRLDGYGYLVARGEGLATLGVVWESSLFAGRAPEGHVLVRVILGGARDPSVARLPESARIALARAELEPVLGVTAEPERAWSFAWPGAIAQYVRGHRERVKAARETVARHAGLSLCGTAYEGISFGAAIEAGRAHADALLDPPIA